MNYVEQSKQGITLSVEHQLKVFETMVLRKDLSQRGRK
jgi:hypothetical protein